MFLPFSSPFHSSFQFELLDGLTEGQHAVCRGSESELPSLLQAIILVTEVQGEAPGIACKYITFP